MWCVKKQQYPSRSIKHPHRGVLPNFKRHTFRIECITSHDQKHKWIRSILDPRPKLLSRCNHLLWIHILNRLWIGWAWSGHSDPKLIQWLFECQSLLFIELHFWFLIRWWIIGIYVVVWRHPVCCRSSLVWWVEMQKNTALHCGEREAWKLTIAQKTLCFGPKKQNQHTNQITHKYQHVRQ